MKLLQSLGIVIGLLIPTYALAASTGTPDCCCCDDCDDCPFAK